MPGADLAQVKDNLARLFQADPQRIAALFSGRRIVIKGNLDAEAAEKYRLTLARAGARVEVAPLGQARPAGEAASAAPPAAVAGAFPALRVAPRDEYMAAFRDVAAPDFGLAPVGVDLQDERPVPPPPALDLGQLSLAPVGSDMGQARAAPAGPPPDTSHLRLVE
ncbi:hypothetical protein NGA35_16445 [Pseudomonas stutzeri]|nr:hypothetical protein [Stutzerimonas stutzeri]